MTVKATPDFKDLVGKKMNVRYLIYKVLHHLHVEMITVGYIGLNKIYY